MGIEFSLFSQFHIQNTHVFECASLLFDDTTSIYSDLNFIFIFIVHMIWLFHTQRDHTQQTLIQHIPELSYFTQTQGFSHPKSSQANSHSHSLNLNLHFLFALQAFGSCFNYSMPAHFVSVHKMSTFSTFQTNIFISTASINFYWPVMKLSWHRCTSICWLMNWIVLGLWPNRRQYTMPTEIHETREREVCAYSTLIFAILYRMCLLLRLIHGVYFKKRNNHHSINTFYENEKWNVHVRGMRLETERKKMEITPHSIYIYFLFYTKRTQRRKVWWLFALVLRCFAFAFFEYFFAFHYPIGQFLMKKNEFAANEKWSNSHHQFNKF